jgi:hypothetical protein
MKKLLIGLLAVGSISAYSSQIEYGRTLIGADSKNAENIFVEIQGDAASTLFDSLRTEIKQSSNGSRLTKRGANIICDRGARNNQAYNNCLLNLNQNGILNPLKISKIGFPQSPEYGLAIAFVNDADGSVSLVIEDTEDIIFKGADTAEYIFNKLNISEKEIINNESDLLVSKTGQNIVCSKSVHLSHLKYSCNVKISSNGNALSL